MRVQQTVTRSTELLWLLWQNYCSVINSALQLAFSPHSLW